MPVTVYVVVTVGLAVTVTPVDADKAVAGDHEEERLPVSVVETPDKWSHLNWV